MESNFGSSGSRRPGAILVAVRFGHLGVTLAAQMAPIRLIISGPEPEGGL